MIEIVEFTRDYVDKVIDYEKRLRQEEPDTYFWEPDDEYRDKIIASFSDERFVNAVSFLAIEKNAVIGRIDASIVSSRNDGECYAAYLDWICVLKSKRHLKVAQMMLTKLREELKNRGTSMLIALMARNDEAQRFYRSVENAEIHDEGIWMNI